MVDDAVLPFSEVLDWTLASVKCPSCDLRGVVSKIQSLPAAMVSDWRMQVLHFYRRYFSSMAAIVMTTLGILNDRVFTISAKSYDVRVEPPPPPPSPPTPLVPSYSPPLVSSLSYTLPTFLLPSPYPSLCLLLQGRRGGGHSLMYLA